jgi:thioredoxin 1
MKPLATTFGAAIFASVLGAQVSVPALTPQTLDGTLKGGRSTIIEFGGPTCIPCKKMQPVLAEIQKTLGAKGVVYNFYITEHPDTAKRFKVMVMPTQIVFDASGKEVLRHQGYWELDAFRAALKSKGLL